MFKSRSYWHDNPAPDPLSASGAFREWVRQRAQDIFDGIGDDRVFKIEVVDEILGYVPRQRTSKLDMQRRAMSDIRAEIQREVGRVIRSFGDPFLGEDRGFVKIPAHGEVGSSYYRRKCALEVTEIEALISSFLASRKRMSSKIRLAQDWLKARVK